MTPMEKREIRDFLSRHLDLAKTRLSDADALFLLDLVKNWSKHGGRSISYANMGDGWGSDGKYTRVVETTITLLTDQVGVQIETSRSLDGVSQGTERVVVTNGRELLELFKKSRAARQLIGQ